MDILRSSLFVLLPCVACIVCSHASAAPPLLTEADIKPCEELLAKSLADQIERSKEEVRRFGPGGDKRASEMRSYRNQFNLDGTERVEDRWRREKERLEKLSGFSTLEWALFQPPYTPLYDLKDTRMFMATYAKPDSAMSALSETDQKRRASGIGSFRCMLDIRLAQLRRNPAPKPAAAKAAHASQDACTKVQIVNGKKLCVE